MKILPLALTVAASLFAVSSMHAQTNARVTTRQNSNRVRATDQRNVATPLPPAGRTDGVVPRVIRSGNPLQMINPAAPAEYGNGQDVTRREPEDPNARPQGLRLLVVEF